jgi:glycosyltransferase involved in cell wall biosynthesis
VTRVLLLRGVDEGRSMERFADELERRLRARAAFAVAATTVRPRRIGARLGVPALDRYVSRYVRYPLAVRGLAADVYHITDGAYGHLAAVLPPARTVATCHDLMLLRAVEGGAGFQGRPLSVRRYRWSVSFLRRIRHVVCSSESTRTDVIRLVGVPPERTSVVPPGVASRFRPLADDERRRLRGELDLDGRHVVLHVSTGLPYKNVPATLRVLAALREQGYAATLLRAGEPLTAIEGELARELRVDEHVLDLGRVSDERLIELYNIADVLVFPSYHEGFGWPPLEAMACGTPVVVSESAPLAEVVGSAALTAPADDAAALAERVTRLLDSPELAAALRARGLERAARFSWQRTLDGYANVYRQVACAPTVSARAEGG